MHADEVRAGGERSIARASDNAHPDVVTPVDLAQVTGDGFVHLRVHRVHLLGPVEGDGGHGPLDFKFDQQL
jgi:hypothetical protein